MNYFIKSWPRLLYLCCALWFLHHFSHIQDMSEFVERGNWLFPLNLLPITSPRMYLSWTWSIALGFLVLAVWNWRWASAISLLFSLILFSLLNSYESISVALTGLIFCMGGMTLASLIDRNDKKLQLKCAVAGTIYMYVCAGLAKLLHVIQSSDISLTLNENISRSVAYGAIESSSDKKQWIEFFSAHPLISSSLWVGVMILEIFAPLIILIFSAWAWILLLLLGFYLILVNFFSGVLFLEQIFFHFFFGLVMLAHRFQK